MRAASLGATGEWFERAACILRRVIGAPDYEGYVRHMHEHHPDTEPITRDEFVRQRMESRYMKPGNRCC